MFQSNRASSEQLLCFNPQVYSWNNSLCHKANLCAYCVLYCIFTILRHLSQAVVLEWNLSDCLTMCTAAGYCKNTLDIQNERNHVFYILSCNATMLPHCSLLQACSVPPWRDLQSNWGPKSIFARPMISCVAQRGCKRLCLYQESGTKTFDFKSRVWRSLRPAERLLWLSL